MKEKLSVRKENAKGAAGSISDDSHSGLAKALCASHFRGEQAPVQMSLETGLPGAEGAFFPW